MQAGAGWRQCFVLALLVAGAARAAAGATKTALLSPTANTAEEKIQLDELQSWAAKAGHCPGLERCDDLGCSCQSSANDYVAPKSDGPVSWLVLFCVEWAERCRKFSKVLNEIAPDLRGLYKIGYIDAEEKPDLALKQLGIHVYPTLLAFPHGFGGGHRPLEYDRPKGAPGKIASWALGQLPNRAVQVFSSDEVLRATSSKHVAVVLFNDKSVTPAGFKAAALRHAHALAHSNSKHLRFAEVRKSQYAAVANGQDGTDLGEFVRKFGPGMDQRQWPQIVILQKKKPNTNTNVVTWEQTKYSIERFTFTQINDKKAHFYVAEFEKALQATVAAMPQPHASATGTAAQPTGATGGYQLPAPGSARTQTEAPSKSAAAPPKAPPVDRIPAHIKPPPPAPPLPPIQSPPPTQPLASPRHNVGGYTLTASPVPALVDGLFVASGEYNARPIYRRMPKDGAQQQAQQRPFPALYWHSKRSMWVFHAAFSEAAGEHGLGHAQFKTEGTTLETEPPVGKRTWNCWINAKWKDCELTVTAMSNLASPLPPTSAPATTNTRSAAEDSQKDEVERTYQKQKAAADAAAKRKHAEAAAAASKILEHRSVKENVAKSASPGVHMAAGTGSDLEQEELDMAAKIETLEHLLMQGKLSPDKYERARGALEKQGQEQQKNRKLRNEELSRSAEQDASAAMRKLRAIKTETEAAELKLNEQLRRGELSPQAFQVEKAKVRAHMDSEAHKVRHSAPSMGNEAERGAERDNTAVKNAETLRQAGEARRAAADAAQAHYAEQMGARQRREEEVAGVASAQHSEKLKRHLALQKELDAAAQARARTLERENKNELRGKQEL